MFIMENKAATGIFVASKTSVWWDIDSAPVPAGFDPSLVGPSIHLALEKLGYRGPITITAVGKLKRTSEDVMRAISSTGITVKYSGLGWKSTYSELFTWRVTNPAPATIMFISSSSALKCLSNLLRSVPKQYNMLLAYRSSLPKQDQDPELVTSPEWPWKSLLKEAMCSDGKLEAKRQILQEKRGERGESDSFTCTLCFSAWRSLEAFTTHLQCLDHEVNKFGIRANPAYLDTLSQDSLEKELEDLLNFLNGEAALLYRQKKLTTKLNRTSHLLKQKKQWEELKKKLQESGRSASQVAGEKKERCQRYLAKERASYRKKMKRARAQLKKREQLASQGQHEQGTELELEASWNGEEGGVEKETDEPASHVQPHEQEEQLELLKKKKFVNEGAESSRQGAGLPVQRS